MLKQPLFRPITHPHCLADHKVLSTLEKPRESASAPTLEAAIPETSNRSSVSSRIQILPHCHVFKSPQNTDVVITPRTLHCSDIWP